MASKLLHVLGAVPVESCHQSVASCETEGLSVEQTHCSPETGTSFTFDSDHRIFRALEEDFSSVSRIVELRKMFRYKIEITLNEREN